MKLHGLKGGHSGIDIHLQRGNAVQLLARMIHAISHGTPGFLAGIEGGNMHNAIPREAWATVVIPEDQSGEFLLEIGKQFELVKEEFKSVEPGMELTIEEAPAPTDGVDHRHDLEGSSLPGGPPPRGRRHEQRHPRTGGDQHEPGGGQDRGRPYSASS